MSTLLVSLPTKTARTYAWYRGGRHVGTTTVLAGREGVVATTSTPSTSNCTTTYTEAALESAVGVALTEATTAGLITSAAEVSVVAVKVMAPGSYFAHHRLVDELFLAKLDAVEELVTSYVSLLKEEIHTVQAECPEATLVAMSDSALHTTVDRSTQTPSLRASIDDAGGYHGFAVAAALARTATLAGVVPERTIVLHIDEESSVTLLKNGHSVVTSMGLTPTSGAIMQHGGGDLGADAFAAYLIEHQLSPEDGLAELQTNGGFAALCGECDLESLTARSANHDEVAGRALDRFYYMLRSHVAAQVAYAGGVDALVLSGPELYQNDVLRTQLLRALSVLRIQLDEQRNSATICREGNVATTDSVPVYVVKGDEPAAIATLALEVIAASGN